MKKRYFCNFPPALREDPPLDFSDWLTLPSPTNQPCTSQSEADLPECGWWETCGCKNYRAFWCVGGRLFSNSAVNTRHAIITTLCFCSCCFLTFYLLLRTVISVFVPLKRWTCLLQSGTLKGSWRRGLTTRRGPAFSATFRSLPLGGGSQQAESLENTFNIWTSTRCQRLENIHQRVN